MKAKIALASILVIFLSPLLRAQPVEWEERNILANPDFEQGAKGWKGFGDAATIDTEKAKSGRACLRITAGEKAVSVSQKFTVSTRMLRAKMMAASTGLKGAAGMKISCFDTKGKLLEEIYPCHLPEWETPWRKYSKTVVLPEGTRTIVVELTATGGTAWFDDVSIQLPRAPERIADAIKKRGWVYLSDAEWSAREGTVIRNAQKPSWKASEELQVADRVYEKGLGMVAPAQVTFETAGAADGFRAIVGVHRLGKGGSARFIVYGDGKQLFDSGKLTKDSPAKAIDIPIKGVKSLRLVVKGDEGTEANWCDAVLLTAKVTKVPDSSRKIHPVKGGFKVKRMELPSPVSPLWTIDAADLDADGKYELILGRIDGKVSAFTPRMKKLWVADVGGLPFVVKCGDVNGDGKKEVVVASLNKTGDLHLISNEGKRIWSVSLEGRMFNTLAVGDTNLDGKDEIVVGYGGTVTVFNDEPAPIWQRNFGGPRVASLAIGDVTSDERPEIVIGFSSQSLRAAALSGDGKLVWTFSSPELAGGLKLISPRIADINNDRENEIVFGFDKRSVLALKGNGEKLWCRRFIGERDFRGKFSAGSALVEVADFAPESRGLETLLIFFDRLYMLDSNGYQIWEGKSGVKIIGSVLAPDSYRGLISLFFPSSGFRDENIYRATFERGGENALARVEVRDKPTENLEKARKALESRKKLHDIPAKLKAEKFHIIVFVKSDTDFIKQAYSFLKKRGSENMEYIMMMWTKELPTELHRGKLMTQEQIVNLARFCERNRIPFFLFVDHGCGPYITVETAKKVLDAAPKWSRGFYVAEDSSLYPSEKWDKFIAWVTKIMDLCAERGKKVIFKEMFDCWAFLPADPDVFYTLFKPKYRDVIVPMFATNNAHAPELTLAGMVGLRMMGWANSWGMSSQNWNWNWDKKPPLDFSNICPDDVIFRMDLVAAALGATYFHIEGGQSFLKDATSLTADARLHRDFLQELMRRNIILPVKPDRIKSIPNLMIVRGYNPAVKECEGCGTPSRRSVPALRDGLLGVRYTLMTTAEDYFGHYAYRSRMYISGLFPSTPYGFIPIVPEEGARLFPPRRRIYTDGNGVWLTQFHIFKESAKSAKKRITELLRKGARMLPVQADEGFLAVHKLDGEYRLFLVDTGYLNPVGCSVSLRINLFGRKFEVRDLLTGERVPCKGKVARVRIPAGSFLVLSVKRVD